MVAGSHRLGVSNITVAVKYHDGWERIHEAFRPVYSSIYNTITHFNRGLPGRLNVWRTHEIRARRKVQNPKLVTV